MKKVLAIFTLCAGMGMCATTYAEPWHHGGGHYVWRPGYGWVVPAVVGGLIVYGATQPRTVVVQQPVPVAPPPTYAPPPAPYGYHWEQILDAGCNCYKTVLVPN